MIKYIGVVQVDASPTQDDGLDGYNVMDNDGFAHFIAKEEFERSYLPIQMENNITQADVDSMIARVQTSDADTKTTIVRAECLTGFTVFETASCVAPENYDQNKGTMIAMSDVNKKLWFAMGFILQWARYGLKYIPKTIQSEGAQDGNPE